MARQSTQNVLLIEPVVFGYNTETASTNGYQNDARETSKVVYARALEEFRGFRDALVEAGVGVTTMRGVNGCPDAIFPNWFSTHENGTCYLYPMMAPNRARERGDDLVGFLKRFYEMKTDFLPQELQGKPLESTGSMVLDRVHHVAYIGRSKRTDETLALEWCARNDYEAIVFDTVGHDGKPIYHTDLVIWIGTEICGVGAGVIVSADRARVLESLSKNREVLEFENAQIHRFCGNSLELRGQDDALVFVMSDTAYGMLTSDQLSRLHRYYTRIVAPKITTIETYGGGSARCMIQELF